MATFLAHGGGTAPATETPAAALGPLPLEVLGLSGRELGLLDGLGIATVRWLLGLPRAGLARRLGPALVSLLDRALGRAPDPWPRFEPPACFETRLDLPEEVHPLEVLLFALLALFRERLNGLSLRAPVRALVMRTEAIAPLRDPLALWPLDQGPRGAEEGPRRLIERLRARLGESAVAGLCAVADHHPERAWASLPAGRAHHPSPVGGSLRPLWLLKEPRPLSHQDGRPYLCGPLEAESGPERIEPGWWDGQDIARDYFVAHGSHGTRFWIYRDLR